MGIPKVGKLFFDLNYIKEIFDVPQDLFFRDIKINERDEIEIIYYTNTDWAKAVSIDELENINNVRRVSPALKKEYIMRCYEAINK